MAVAMNDVHLGGPGGPGEIVCGRDAQVPAAGTYAIAIRHDVNGNGGTDLRTDGGGMSNNPSINIFNLGRPSVERTRFSVGREVKPMSIRMRYM